MKAAKNFNKRSDCNSIIVLDSENIISTSSSSKGNQIKWSKGDRWYKSNFLGYENVAEVVSSILGSCIKGLNSVKYDLCEISYKDNLYDCCVSNNFLAPGEEIITFYRLLKSKRLYNTGFNRMRPAEKLKVVMELQKWLLNVDLEEYLVKILYFDALILNEDRHLNNLALISYNGMLLECPIFDNGLSLLSDVHEYSFSNQLKDNIVNVQSKPFSEDFDTQLRLIENLSSFKLSIDFKLFYSKINTYNFKGYEEELERCLDVLDYTFNRLEGIIWK